MVNGLRDVEQAKSPLALHPQWHCRQKIVERSRSLISPAVLLVVGVALVGRVAPELAYFFVDRGDQIIRKVLAVIRDGPPS